MQNYPNNNYYSQYQPQFNPYMQRMENLQQFQQALQQPISPAPMSATTQFAPMGKIVESMDIVKVTDIPMDGNMYYFPKADGTEIYSKQFMTDGKTRILTFKPLLDSEVDNSSMESVEAKFDTFKQFLEGIQNDIKTLNDKVDKISKPSRAKKEVVEDE